jgi:plasmid stabilization system protein ParE
MARYTLSDAAKDDLRAITSYIRKDSPRAAKSVRFEIQKACKYVADHRRCGHTREDLTHRPVLFWRVYSYMIVYRPDTKPLQIVRIIHGAQDVARELRLPQ